ncbi:MAG: radical SAM protein [Candidatus Omnitrophica bacterium]|nr:radical SAM protein [Candidatus Omnitrophota bacterium]
MRKLIKSYQRLKEVFTDNPFPEAIFKVFRYFSPSMLKDKYFCLKGIKSKYFAFSGPFSVQIDLTDECNNRCLACWCNSPLLGENNKNKDSLAFPLVINLLEELEYLRTREIVLSGGGEPFLYPEVLRVLERIKQKEIICHINTNFALLNKKIIDELIKLRLDYLTISLWAGSVKTYKIIHPNRNEEDFYRIKENLIFLNSLKRKLPKVKIYNVIFNLNYFEMEEMLKFAEDVKADYIEYTILDVIPDKTDVLLPNREEFKKIKEISQRILQRKNKIKILNFEHFLRRISQEEAIKGEYERNFINSIPCYSGWLFSRILANGNVIPCLKAHRFPVGNLYKNSFREIWNGELMQEFRRKTINGNRDDNLFYLIGNGDGKDIGCFRICDDLVRNLYFYNRINSLTYLEGIIFRLIS